MKFVRLPFLLLSLSSFLFAQPSLEQKIGSMIMVGFDGTSVPESIKADLQLRRLGGVVLFKNNIIDPLQIQTLTSELQSLSPQRLLIAVDQEGGKVARFTLSNGFDVTPTAYKLGTVINNEDSTRAAAALMAGWLSESGININFAPVADVNVNPNSPAIGAVQRSYSADPIVVGNHDRWFIGEFHRKNIFTTLKHFPGHGSAAADSHLGFTDITNTWSSAELIPFRSAVDSGIADLIMIGHLFNQQIDSVYPASLSSHAVASLLRDSLNFHGVVISDELFMNAISANYTFDTALELCVKSGTDILLFKTNLYNASSLTAYVVNVIASKVRNGIIAESIIDSAYNRIERLRSRIPASVRMFASAVPSESGLLPNFPNPFNGTTTIRYRIHQSSFVHLRVYDLLGREIAVLVQGEQPAGTYSAQFSFRGNVTGEYASGVYFYRLQADNFSETKKMVYVK